MDVVFLMTNQTLIAQSTQFATVLMAFRTRQSIVHTVQHEIAMEIFGDAPAPLGVTLVARGS